jgi:hypothetical protein
MGIPVSLQEVPAAQEVKKNLLQQRLKPRLKQAEEEREQWTRTYPRRDSLPRPCWEKGRSSGLALIHAGIVCRGHAGEGMAVALQ